MSNLDILTVSNAVLLLLRFKQKPGDTPVEMIEDGIEALKAMTARWAEKEFTESFEERE